MSHPHLVAFGVGALLGTAGVLAYCFAPYVIARR